MPELPEVEITARRLSRAAAGATIESALAPGMVTMKTFDPPLDAIAGTWSPACGGWERCWSSTPASSSCSCI